MDTYLYRCDNNILSIFMKILQNKLSYYNLNKYITFLSMYDVFFSSYYFYILVVVESHREYRFKTYNFI